MAFITNGSDTLSFAEYSDVLARDARVFEANEGLDETVVEDQLIRSTERIMTMLKDSDWWVSNGPTGEDPDINLIISRVNDFTDLCVYHTMYDYLLPLIADFGTEDNAEVMKIDYYEAKFNKLSKEIIEAGDFYDFDSSGVITDANKALSLIEERRYR